MIKLFYNQSVEPVHPCVIPKFSKICSDVTYDECSDCSESGDGLTRAMMKFDLDNVLLGLFHS